MILNIALNLFVGILCHFVKCILLNPFNISTTELGIIEILDLKLLFETV